MFYLIVIQLYNYLPHLATIPEVGMEANRAKSVETAGMHPVCSASGVW